MLATCSRSRVARSRSVRPCAASTARVATSSASVRFCPAIDATALMRSRNRVKAWSCSPAASAMRPACAVASAVAATMASRASSAAAESSSTPPTFTSPRRICSTTSPTWRWLSCTRSPASAAAVPLCSARCRTSSATTANPLTNLLADRRNESRDAAAHLPQLLHLARALADERLQRDEALDGVADLRAVAARHLARGARGSRCARAVVGHAPRHLRQTLRGLESAGPLAPFPPYTLADHARRGGHGRRRLLERLGGLRDRCELARHALDRL